MIDNQIGKFFPPAVKSVGYVFMVFGTLFILVNPLLGIGVAIIGAVVAFLVSGVQIDRESNKLRDYTGLFKLKFGNWESMEEFSDIAVLKKRITTTAFSRANRPATTSDELVYDICLLDKTHRTKKVIQRLPDVDAATTRAKQLSESLNLSYGPYNPEISEASRAKKR